MRQNQLCWLMSVSLAVLGTIAGFCNSDRTQAQPIVSDSSSGSRVSSNDRNRTDRILGGTQRGNNLFHSFTEFNVGAGRTVSFVNVPASIQNIITRVTGNNPSRIDGTLDGSPSRANLFLINPNGILFGSGASLNLRGAFIASTANAIQFGDRGSFSVTDPQPPSPLLTVNPSALLFNQVTAQAIRSQGELRAEGSLMIVGGQLTLDGGLLSAARVELAAVAGTGVVNLTSDSTGWRLAPLTTVALTDITLDRGVQVIANGRGAQLQGRDLSLNANALINAPHNTVQIYSRNLSLNQNAQIDSAAGRIQINSQDVTLNQRSVLIAPDGNIQMQARDILLDQSSQVDAANGEIDVQGRRIELRNGSQFSTVTRNDRPSGNLTVTATEAIQLVGTNADGFSSGLFTSSQGNGSAGNLRLTTPFLSVRDGARVFASTLSSGQGGNLQVTANTIELTGVAAIGGRSSGLFAFAEGGTGSAGTITIDVDRLNIQNGAQISTSTFNGSQGTGGNLTIQAAEFIQLSGTSATGYRSSVLVGTDGLGNAGALTIQTPNLQVDNQAVISARTGGQGQGGSLTVISDRVALRSGGEISAESLGAGDAGKITVQANQLVIENGLLTAATTNSGRGGDLQVSSDQVTVRSGGQMSVRSSSSGSAGNLAVAARELNVETNGRLTAETSGQGRSGNVTVRSDRLTVQSGGQVSVRSSGSGDAGNLAVTAGVLTAETDGRLTAETSGQGRGGSVTVSSDQLTVRSGGQISVRSNGSGDAGNLAVAAGRLTLETNGKLTADTSGQGRGGSVAVSSDRLIVRSGAEISVKSQGGGRAGNMAVRSSQMQLDSGGKLTAETASGDGGNITIAVADILWMRRGAQISTTAGTAQAGGNGGNIRITAPFVIGFPIENSDITANAFTGSGGNVQITAQGIFGLQFRPALTPESDITASSTFGTAGTVELNILDADPSQGLVALPAELTDQSRQIVQSCAPGQGATSSFVTTGRGGLPTSPEQPLGSRAVVAGWVTVGDKGDRGDKGYGGDRGVAISSSSPSSLSPSSTPIAEAQALVSDRQGNVYLVAQSSTTPLVIPWLKSPTCPTVFQN